jgi:hypothetical protein
MGGNVPPHPSHEVLAYFHFFPSIYIDLEQGRLVSIMTRLRSGQPGNRGSIASKGNRFPSASKTFTPALRPRLPPVQRTLGASYMGCKSTGLWG